VEVRSGLDEHSRLHGTYCGSQPPQPVTSHSNAVRITFTSDNTVQKTGFSAFFFTGNSRSPVLRVLTGNKQMKRVGGGIAEWLASRTLTL